MTDKPYDTRQNIRPTSYFDKEHRPTIRVDNKQITDLFNLVGNMNINEVKQFMIMEQLPFSVVDNNNNTLIHRVLLDSDLSKTETQRLQMIKYLFNENVNPDGPNNNNLTPLHIACSKQYYHIIKYLIEIGVNVNYQDNFGNTPLHRLFSGAIKIEEKTTIGSLIPRPKKKDSINSAKWKVERGKIWNDINTSPFIKAIDETLRNSIGSDEDEIKVVIEFQQLLSQMTFNLENQDEIKRLKELHASSITKFKTIIEKRWGTLPNIEDIIIHTPLEDSFPLDDPSRLAIIKNSDTNKYITKELGKSLSNMNKLLTNINIPEFIDNKFIDSVLLLNYVNTNRTDLNQTNLEMNDITYNEEINNYRIGYDFADNIINLDNNTFIGGARICNIINNITNNQYNDLFNKNEELIIPTLVYTIFTDYATATNFNGTYDIRFLNDQQTVFYGYLAQFIVDIINNTSTTNIGSIINIINNGYQFHKSLIPLIETVNEAKDKASWLYCFINNFLCNKRFQEMGHVEPNLICDINLSVIYLIAGIINNKTNLILSISQCMRKSLYISIYNTVAIRKFGFLTNIPNNLIPGSTLCALIYLIFTTDIRLFDIINNLAITEATLFNFIDTITIDNVNLNFIMKYTYNIFNNINNIGPIPDDLKPIFELSSDKREHICNMISYYYNKMNQPPQNQMVADLIGLIRKTHDNTTDDPDIDINERLQSFIIPIVANRNLLPNTPIIYSVIEPSLPNLIRIRGPIRNSKLFKIIGENESVNALILWSALEYVLPSRVNLFLSIPITTFTGDEDDKMCIMKFIECYYLGLNFIGHIPTTPIIPNIDLTRQRPPGPNIVTRYNLYNFDNGMPRDDNTNRHSFQTLNDSHFYRPTTIISVAFVIESYYIRINRLVKILADKLNSMFINMFRENSSTNYASVISYCYPYLLILSNYSKIIKGISNQVKDSRFQDGFQSINTQSNIDIIERLNNFQEFRISNFESIINQINGYIYLLYYVNSKTPGMKIPKFIYHTLGANKPLIVFDDNEAIRLKNITSDYNDPYIEKNLDDKKGSINRNIGLFSNVINNIGYTSREILKESFIISKNKKLPPSLSVVLIDFYRLNIIETIKTNTTKIDETIVNADINASNKNIQLLYLKSKIIEELIKLNIKNKIHEYAIDIYNRLITDKFPNLSKTLNTQLLLKTDNFSIDLNKEPSKDFINNLTIATQSGLKLYYSFVEPKKIKEQFYIYPDNYFGSNLLKTKYTININLDIIELMLQNNSNILLHNNEKISPLVMMIKNNYYEAFKTNAIKNNFDMSSYDNNNYHSPQYYLIENFKNHLDNYYKKMSESQYTEMINIIQSNESYNNNILKYMDVSFNVVKYIVHQYLTENMLRFSDDFNSDSLKDILKLVELDVSDINNIGKCQYNDNLGSNILIPNADEGIVINELKQELTKKKDESMKILAKYNHEKTQIDGLNMNTANIDSKILIIKNKIAEYTTQLTSLATFNFVQLNPLNNINQIKIIHRYDNLRNTIGQISYMEGWKQFIKNKLANIEQFSFYLITYQNIKDKKIILQNINIIHKFYKHNNNIIKTYFENQRYIDDNKVLGFVYDLLVHLTKTFICSNISSIIKKILYEYIISTQNIPIAEILNQINLMVNGIDDVLYNIIPKKFVRNSVNIYINEDDELANPIESVSEILNNLIDLLKTSSYIEIDDYTINILKNSINPYFDTITYKLINNWNVVIENIFLFHINQYRILECIIQLYK